MVHTRDGEVLCALAMASCRSNKPASKIGLTENTVKRFIKMAINLGHESVLEHAVITFDVSEVSRSCTHQLVRHRVASYSQQSQRHVKINTETEWYITPPIVKENNKVNDLYKLYMEQIATHYNNLLNLGIPEEDARFILPNACKSNIVVTMNCRELRHFFKLRCDPDAQWEIRVVAKEMIKLSYELYPTIFEDLYVSD